MKEIDLLMERAAKTLKSAKLLLQEKDYDSSVSRSYYAMFYATEAVLLTKRLRFSSHKSVISLFGKHFVKTGIFDPKLGKNLRKAFEKRLIGDYSFTPEIDEKAAEETFSNALEFVENMKSYLQKKGFYSQAFSEQRTGQE